MSHWKVYEPITKVSAYLDRIASLSDVQVTACVEGRTLTPITIAVEGCSLSLTLEKSTALRALLERAEADVRTAMRTGQEPS